MGKRTYTRRTDEERIKELEEKISKIKQRVQTKRVRQSPVMKEAAKVQRALRRFAQVAVDHGREDLANSTQAFAAGLDRSVAQDEKPPARRSRAASSSSD